MRCAEQFLHFRSPRWLQFRIVVIDARRRTEAQLLAGLSSGTLDGRQIRLQACSTTAASVRAVCFDLATARPPLDKQGC